MSDSQIISGSQFESRLCWIFFGMGYWSHRIARDSRGAQPFDVIAIKGLDIYAVDCKVCSQPRFVLTRAEINQQLAFLSMREKTAAKCGFMCYYDGDIYFVPSEMVSNCSKASIPLTKDLLWMTMEETLKVRGIEK